MTTLTADKRQEYKAKIKAELDKMDARISEYQARASQLKADLSTEYQRQLEQLMAKRDAAASKLEQLQSAGSEAWEEMQGGFESAWEELNQAFQAATAQFEQSFK